MQSLECRFNTTVPYDFRHTSTLEERVQCGDGWIQALRGEID